RGIELHAGDRRESDRSRERMRRRRAEFLRPQLHLGRMGRPDRRVRSGRRRCAGGDARPRVRGEASRQLGLLPRPPTAALRPHLRGHLKHAYLIALGSNRRHHRLGCPRDVLAAALERLRQEGVEPGAVAPVLVTEPVGPSLRRYANSATVVRTSLDPPALLDLAKRLEREFGRRNGGQRWTARVLDLDLILWSGGAYAEPGLTIPHPLFRERAFVLGPAVRIAPDWRDPITGLTIRQLHARLTSPRAVRRAPTWSGP